MDIQDVKKDFPILEREILGNKLVYLDNAATSQKPSVVINALTEYYTNHNANVHRGLHTLSEEASEMYDNARKSVADFIGGREEEVVFTKGATESLNRIAFEWAVNNIKAGEKIVTTDAEHHSNLIPWQIVAKRVGAEVVYLDTNENGQISIDQAKNVIDEKTKLVAITQASNMLGTIFPVKEIADIAHKVGAVVAVDGAQAIPHMKVNVASLGCDFYAFSGHKMLAPTGVGALWVKKEILDKLVPYEYGGGMIDIVSYTDATYAEGPGKFEAGTPNIAGAIGLAMAISYLTTVGMDAIREHEVKINAYAIKKLTEVPGLKIYGPLDPTARTGLVSFTVEGMHSHDIAAVLNSTGVAVRSGHHCTMPLHKKLGIPASTRASWYLYNNLKDIDALVEGIYKAKQVLKA